MAVPVLDAAIETARSALGDNPVVAAISGVISADAIGAKFRWDESPPLHESEVKVKVGGIPRMAIRVAGVEGYLALPETLDIIIRNVRDGLAALKPFVRS